MRAREGEREGAERDREKQREREREGGSERAVFLLTGRYVFFYYYYYYFSPLYDAGDSCQYPVVGVHGVALRMLARAGPYVYVCLFYPVSVSHMVGI